MALVAIPPYKTLYVKVVLVGAFLTALTLLKTYPLIEHFHTQLPGGTGDPLLVSWILAWGAHALTTDPFNLFNANIFYPVQNALAFSEHMIAVVPIFAPAYFLTGNPIFAYNAVFFLAFILSGLSMFLLVHHWTGNDWAALVSSCLFAFAPIRFAELGHVQLANFYWAPLALLYLDRFLWSQRWTDLTWFAVFYWLQVLASVYLGWFITIGVGVYVLYHVLRVDRSLLNRRMISYSAAFIVSSLVVLLPFHLPYYVIQQQWGFSTVLQECIHWAADPVLNYLSPPYLFNQAYLSLVQAYFPRLHDPPNNQMLFPGLVLSFLAVIGGVASIQNLPAGRSPQLQRALRLMVIVAVLLSLGPFLVILGHTTSVPLPYLLLYYLVPGFQAMRVPGRFVLMGTLAASALAALGFLKSSEWLHQRWNLRHPRVQALLAFVWIALFAVELGFKPLPMAAIPTGQDVPQVYQWLATEPLHGPILELPLGESFWEALKYMYFSTYHWLPLVNGSSRFYPPPYRRLSAEIAALPSREAAEFLSSVGVQAVIVHTDQLMPAEASRWQHANLAALGMEEMARFGADVVYKLPSVETTSDLELGLLLPSQLPTQDLVVLPAGAIMRLGLGAKHRDHRPWVDPSLLGQTQVLIRWEAVETGTRLIHSEIVESPLALRTGAVWSTGVPIRTPRVPGRYSISLDLPQLGVGTPPRLIEVSSKAFQTSTDASQGLSAAYVVKEPTSRRITSSAIDVTLQATNTGVGVWLAHAQDDRGKVRLGWRWYQGTNSVPFKEGREDLAYDIFPGQAYQFRTTIKAPHEPGEYTLELGLVSELLTWFSDRGVPAVKFIVHVRRGAEPDSAESRSVARP